MAPTFGNGKICCLEIPAADIAAAAQFYSAVSGWHIRTNTDGNLSFDNGVGEVSGMWVKGRPAHREIGLLVLIMVLGLAGTLQLVKDNVGTIVQAPGPGQSESLARFIDPSGNVFCLYQHNSGG